MARRFSGMSYDYGGGGGGGDFSYGYRAPDVASGADDFAEGFGALSKVLLARRADSEREKRSADIYYRQNTKHIPADKLKEFEKDFETNQDPKILKTPEGKLARAEHAIKQWDDYKQRVTDMNRDIERNAAEMEAVRKAQEKTSTDLTRDFAKQRSDALNEQQKESKAEQTYTQRLASQARTTEAARRAAARAGLPPDSVVGPEAPESPTKLMKSVPIYKEGDEQGFGGVFEQVEIPKSDPRTWLSEEEAAQVRSGGGPATPTSPRPRQAESLVADAASAPARRTPVRNAAQLREAATGPLPAQTAPRRPEAPPHAQPRTAQQIYENTTWNKAVSGSKKAVNEEEKAWTAQGASDVHAQSVVDEYVAWRDANGLPPLDDKQERNARTRVKVQLQGYNAGPNRGRRVAASLAQPGEPEFVSQQPFGLTAEEKNQIAESAWDDPNRPYPGLYADRPARSAPAPQIAPKPPATQSWYDKPLFGVPEMLGMSVKPEDLPPAQDLANRSRPGAVPPPPPPEPRGGPQMIGALAATVPTYLPQQSRDDSMNPEELAQYREVQKEKDSMMALAGSVATRAMKGGATKEEAVAAAQQAIEDQMANVQQQRATGQHALAAPVSERIAQAIDEQLTFRNAGKMAIQAGIMAAATYATGGGALVAAGSGAIGNLVGQAALNKPGEAIDPRQALVEGATVGISSKIPLGGIGRALGKGAVGTTVAGGVREGVQETSEEAISAALEGRPLTIENLATAGILGAVYGPAFEMALGGAGHGGDIEAARRAAAQAAAQVKAQGGSDAVAAQAAGAAAAQVVPGVAADVTAALNDPNSRPEPGSPAAPFGSAAAPVSTDGMGSLLAQFTPEERAFLQSQGLIDQALADQAALPPAPRRAGTRALAPDPATPPALQDIPTPPAPTTAADLAAAAGDVTRRRRARKAPGPPTGAATPTAAVDEGDWQGPLQPTLPETSPDFRTWVDQMLGPGTYAGLEAHFRGTGDASGILELRQAHQQALTGAGDPGATAALADIQTGPLARNAVSEQARQYEQQRLAAARLAPPPTAPAAGHYSVMRGPDGLFYVATVTEPDVTRREAEGETGPGAPGRRSIMGPFREGTAAETAAGLMNQRFTDQFGAAPEPGSLGDLDPAAVMDWERKNAREVFRGAPPAARRGGKNVGSGRAQPAVHEPGTAARLKAEAAAATAAATVPGGKKRAPRKRNPRGAPPPAAPAATPLAGNVDAMLAGLKAQAAEAEKSRTASKAAAKTPPAKSASARVPAYGRDLEADLAKVKGKTVSGELVAKYGLPLGVRKVADVRAYVQEQIRQVAANMPTEPAATQPAAEPDDAGVLADIKEAVRRAKSAEQLAGVLEITPEEAQALIDGRDAEGPTAMADVTGIGMIQQFVDRAKVRKAAQVLRKVEQSSRAKLAGQPRQASGFSGRDSARAWGAGHYQSVDAAVTDALDALAAGRTTGPTGGVLSHERLPSGIDVITEEMPAGTAEPEWDFGNEADTPLLNPSDWGLDDPTLADAPAGPLLKTTLRAPRAAAEMRENGTVFALSQRPDVAGSPAASMDTIRVLRAAAERGGRFEETSNISPQSEDMYRAVSRFSGIPVADLPGMAIADVLSSPGAQRVTRLMDIRDAAAQQRGSGGATAMADPFGFQTLYNAGQKLWSAATGSPGGAGPKAQRVGSALVTGPRSTLEHLSDLGPNGKAIAELFQIYRDAKETLHGRWSATLDQALRKVPESERSAFTDLLEGRARAASAGTQQAVAEARAMLDEVARYAQTNERFNQYLADYFPRIMAERPSLSRKAKAAAQDFWADPTHKAKMQAMGITNWSDPGAAAYAASVLMFPGGRRYGTLAPNLEKHRTGMLQEYRTDPEVLYQYIGQAAKAISHAMAFDNPRVTGPTKSGVANERYGGWKEMWGRLGMDPNVDEDTATGLRSALERELGIEQDKPTAGSKVEQSVRDIVASTSLALSFLNQPQSFADTAATMGLGDSVAALKQVKSQAAVDAAVRAGSVRSQNESKGRSYAEETALAQQPGATGALGDVAKFYRDLPWMNWMQNIDRAMRITADAASRASLDKTVAGINTGDKATLAILKAAGVDPQSLAGLSQQDIQAAMSYGQMSRPAQTAVDTYARRMTELTQQRARPGDLPKSWSTSRGQWISMFMPFKYRQMKSMAAAFKANPKRFIASGLPAYVFLGATTAAMRAVLTGYGVEGEENDEQTTQEKFMSIFGNRPIRPDSPEDLLLRIAQTLARTLPTPMVMTAAQRFQRAGDAGDLSSAILGPVSRLVEGGSAVAQGVQGRGRPTEISPAEWAARGIGTGAALIGGPSAYSYQIQRELMGPTTDFPRKTVPTPAAPGLVGRLLDLKRGETTVGQTVKGVTFGGPDTVSAKRKKRRENIKTNKAQREKLAGEARTYETMRGVPRFQ